MAGPRSSGGSRRGRARLQSSGLPEGVTLALNEKRSASDRARGLLTGLAGLIPGFRVWANGSLPLGSLGIVATRNLLHKLTDDPALMELSHGDLYIDEYFEAFLDWVQEASGLPLQPAVREVVMSRCGASVELHLAKLHELGMPGHDYNVHCFQMRSDLVAMK